MTDHVTAQEWFSSGTRVPYDPVSKKILSPANGTDAADPIQVFERVARDGDQDDNAVWTTFLPGFPDGSFGWAKVDQYLGGNGMAPKISLNMLGKVTRISPQNIPTGRWSAPISLRPFGKRREFGPHS